MEKERKNYRDPTWILLTFAFLFLCTADANHTHTTTHCDENASPETGVHQTATAAPVTSITPHATRRTTACATKAFTTNPAGMLDTTESASKNVTESVSNTTHPSTSNTSPNGTDTMPPKPVCLQGWAIFLISLGAIGTAFLLAGIPVMLYCLFQDRHLKPEQCPQYNRKIYVPPEEEALQLE